MPINPLVQQLLAQQMQNASQPNPSNLAPFAQMATTLAMILANKKGTAQDQKQTKSLADLLATTPGSDVPVTIEGVGDIATESKTFKKRPQIDQAMANQYAAIAGGNPQVLQEVLLKQMTGGDQQKGFSLSPGQVRFDASGNPIASLPAAPADPKGFETYNVRSPDGAIFLAAETPEGLFRLGKDGAPDKSRPVTDGQKVGLSVQAPNVDDLNPAPLAGDKPSERVLAGMRVNTNNLLALTGRLREQLSADPASGLVGYLVTGGQAIKAQVDQVERILGKRDFASVGSIAEYKEQIDAIPWLDAEAKASAAVRANIVRLAYVQAKALDPGGRIAKDDVKAAMEMMAATGGSPQQILAALDELESYARVNAANTYESIRDEPMPDDWLLNRPSKAETLPGFDDLTPEEQAELKRLMK